MKYSHQIQVVMGNGGLLPKGKKRMFAKSLWLSPLSPRVLTFNLRILPVKEHLFPSTFQMEDLISPITASSWYDRVQPNFSFLHLKLHLLVALSPILLETAQSFEGEEERSCNCHLLLLAEIVFVFDIFFFYMTGL